MTTVAIITVLILGALLLAGSVCVVTKAGEKEGISKYSCDEDKEETNND